MRARRTLANAAVTALSLLLVSSSILVFSPGRVEASPAAPRAAVRGGAPAEPISVLEVVREGERNMLRVKNQTPFIVIVYIGGVRVGWMRPYRMGMIRGLVPGYHRLYAHSQYGTTSWGPQDIWIPGTWNLVY
jgi:hypothetical protein